MKKVDWSSSLVAALMLTVAMVANAQQPTKVPRIAYLTADSLSAMSTRTEAFRQGLRELGYVEGKKHHH
jgi:putative tryptophan/tyrosine transport system substrate-binding protein